MNKGNRFGVQGLCFMAACILEGYFLLEYRSMPIMLVIGGVLVLAATYVLANTLWSEYEKQQETKQQEPEQQEQQFLTSEQMEQKWEEMIKIQKAMYVMTKHCAENVKEGIDDIKAELQAEHNLSKQQTEEIVKSEPGITLFKSVGAASFDAAVALYVAKQAKQKAFGAAVDW